MKLPRSVLWIRILLFVLAGFWAAMAIGTFLMLGRDAFAFGYAAVETLPAVLFLTLGLLIRKNGPVMFWTILSVMVVYLLCTLVMVLGEGMVTQLVLPAGVLVLLLRPNSRSFFLRR